MCTVQDLTLPAVDCVPPTVRVDDSVCVCEHVTPNCHDTPNCQSICLCTDWVHSTDAPSLRQAWQALQISGGGNRSRRNRSAATDIRVLGEQSDSIHTFSIQMFLICCSVSFITLEFGVHRHFRPSRLTKRPNTIRCANK